MNPTAGYVLPLTSTSTGGFSRSAPSTALTNSLLRSPVLKFTFTTTVSSATENLLIRSLRSTPRSFSDSFLIFSSPSRTAQAPPSLATPSPCSPPHLLTCSSSPLPRQKIRIPHAHPLTHRRAQLPPQLRHPFPAFLDGHARPHQRLELDEPPQPLHIIQVDPDILPQPQLPL